MKRLYIFGASSLGLYARSVAERTKKFIVCGFFDDNKFLGAEPSRVDLLGRLEDYDFSEEAQGINIVVAVGNNSARMAIVERIRRAVANVDFPNLVDPSACVDVNATICDGALVLPGAVIGPRTMLGNFCIVGANATLGALTRVEDWVNIAPGANIGSEALICHGAFVGLGAAVLQQCTVGDDATVGAGAVVVESVPARALVVGVPAREVER